MYVMLCIYVMLHNVCNVVYVCNVVCMYVCNIMYVFIYSVNGPLDQRTMRYSRQESDLTISSPV